MIKTILLVLLLALSVTSQAQRFEKTRPFKMDKFDPHSYRGVFKRAIIYSRFARDYLKTGALPDDFKRGKVIAIDYYYTQFRAANSFVQISLDSSRFVQLKKLYPSVHAQIDSVPVRFVEQTLAKTIPEAKPYFHGFVVYYQVVSNDPADRKREVNFISGLFNRGFSIDDSPKLGQVREIKALNATDFVQVGTRTLNMQKPDTVLYFKDKEVESKLKELAKGHYIWCYRKGPFRKGKRSVNVFKIPQKDFPGTTPPAFTEGMFGIMRSSYEDSKLRFLSKQKFESSYEVTADLLQALQHYKGDSIVIVMDVTGSMSPYIAQVLKWLHQSDVKHRYKGIVFFNDGNNMKDNKKRIGQTGGIYHTPNFSNIKTTVLKAMKRGSGGDQTENDVEALLYAKKHFGKANYILVADNIAHPRDLPLLSEIDFKVNVLLCNALMAKPYYINVVEKTGGKMINRIAPTVSK